MLKTNTIFKFLWAIFFEYMVKLVWISPLIQLELFLDATLLKMCKIGQTTQQPKSNDG
jgi:hypothetical protein